MGRRSFPIVGVFVPYTTSAATKRSRSGGFRRSGMSENPAEEPGRWGWAWRGR